MKGRHNSLKVLKKIDDSYRVNIPQEIREILHIHKKQDVTLEVVDNKIILTPLEEDSEVNLEPQKKVPEPTSIEDLHADSKPDLEVVNPIEDSYTEPNLETERVLAPDWYWENGVLKHKTTEVVESKPEEVTPMLTEEPKLNTEITEPITESTSKKKSKNIEFYPTDEISLRNYIDLINHNKECPYCGADLESVFDEKCRLKINGKFICPNCKEKLKQSLIEYVKEHR